MGAHTTPRRVVPVAAEKKVKLAWLPGSRDAARQGLAGSRRCSTGDGLKRFLSIRKPVHG